jgi:hypothetical protein
MIVEDGSGIVGANSFATVAEADTYFADRGGNTVWDALADADKEAALIVATDYIEKKFGTRFQGTKKFRQKFSAEATVTFLSNPEADDSVVIDGTTYTFVSSLSQANDILIQSRTRETMSAFVAAINGETGHYHEDTVANTEVSASILDGRRVLLTARYEGEDGNDIEISKVNGLQSLSLNFSTLNGGSENGVSQTLSFPRDNCFVEWVAVQGVPSQVKWSLYELAVRAAASELMPDPATDATGRIVVEKTEKVGPIEETTRYSGFATLEVALGVYPGAEIMMRPLFGGTGGVSR